MVHAGCVFVTGIHPSRIWMSGSFESVRWNACVHRLDLGLYSHPKEFWGNGVRIHVNSKGKIPSTGNFLPRGGSNPWRCIKQDSEPDALPTELLRPPGNTSGVYHMQHAVCHQVQRDSSAMKFYRLGITYLVYRYFIAWNPLPIIVVCCLLIIPETCQCISGTDLLRQFYVLPHWDRSCRSNFLPHPVTVYWHRADQSQHWPYNTRRLVGLPLECQFLSHCSGSTQKKVPVQAGFEPWIFHSLGRRLNH